MRRRANGWLVSAIAVGALAIEVQPAAAADCSTLPNPLYVAGSSASKPLLAEVGRILVTGANPTTIVYQGTGSCNGVDAILSGTQITGSGTSALSYWNSAGTELKCDVPTTAPVNA